MKSISIMLLLFLPLAAGAHHSTTEFDQSKVVTVEGIVVEVFWRNPHVMIRLQTDTENPDDVWELEGMSVSALKRMGLDRRMVGAGDIVAAAGYASTRSTGLMLLNNLMLPDGEELLLRRNARPQFDDNARRYNPVPFEDGRVAEAKAQADGIFRVWTWGRAERGWWFFGGPERFPLTEAALASLERYDEYADNPVLKCIPPGMPATMANPYPMTFVRAGDDIQYRSEEFDIVRTIHMDGDPGAEPEPSPLGYSAGHWQDNTLVVRTTHINAPYFNRVGVRQSAEVVVDERFTVGDDGSRLDWTIKITDPVTLTEPWEWGAHWIWSPGEQVGTYGCTVHD